MGLTRRTVLTAGAMAAARAAAPGIFAQQSNKTGTGKFYERGPVRIYYEESGSGFPLLLLPGGGLNSTIAALATPFNAIEEFKQEYRCIAADLRNAPSGQSTGPVEVDRPWESYADDQLGLMDHLGIDKFMVMGFCIGGPFIWSLLKRAPNRIAAAVLAQPVGWRPEMLDPTYSGRFWTNWGATLDRQEARDHEGDDRQICEKDVRNQPRLRLHRDTRFRPWLPKSDPHLAGRSPRPSLCRRHGMRDARAKGRSEHFPLETAGGTNPPGSAANSFIPAGASACLNGV